EKNILKFKMAQNQLFLMEIHDGRMKINNLGDYVALRQEIEAFLINLNDLSISIDALKEQGGQLYAKLFENEYEFGKHTVVIPDDILYYLPFELLVSKDDFLIKEHIISYASNAYFIENEQIISNSDLDQKVVLFAPAYTSTIPESQLAVRGEEYSLSGAEEEVSVISTLVAAEVFKGKQASKSKFKSLDKNASVLHLAMHANLNDNDPELSSLLFSSSEADYEMHISELYGLNFNAELAVLSACNTGVGGFKNGGELVSIHHAFTTAGIPSTVASLWNAPDLSTKAIMIDFYKNLRNGQDKATALRQAKLRYLNNPENEILQHPFYWAGFILSGDITPLQLQQASFWYRYPILIAAMLFLVVVLVFILIKKKGIFEN
ncbi:MAG: CHAT domain-containing protein, partial [Bacteroidales bacterium]|nr:CHAT domain-containing protein [Bacteroidales bacterium]